MTDTDAILTLVDAIRPILAGCPPDVQGAALADCLALWLAGHDVPGDAAATRKWRADLLAIHIEAVCSLVPLNAERLGTEGAE